MIKGRCPTCKKSFAVAAIDDLPTFPFCSERCRLLDLGRWIDEAYAVPGPPADLETEGAGRPPGADDDED
ncbi:DNA gyrase inhibitor YacG [Paludisphaera mucosa]|uniref:DNA gyrase inhibitor YacG n=1 Tax=Paludisphaera mucosa TaxID=3030827 RepID=A0ABT6F992_9BACT|nr:DNA gyrase inhibitor YacG [Paludisphaera mucosa]MDG3004130.1 DNA gyrase inhibitor YacG [Paludisphaera mucosa]